MDGEDFEKHGAQLLHYVTSYLDNIRSRRGFPDVQPGYLRPLIPDKAPDEPESWEAVFQDVERVIMPGASHFQSPKMFAYWKVSTSYPAILGEILINAISSLGTMWDSFPASVELEVLMMDWLAQMLHLPEPFLFSAPGKGGGIILGNASEAILTCLLAARTQAFRERQKVNPDITLGQMIDRLVAYCSDQAHCSVEKAGMVSGVRMRLLQTDEKGMLGAETLKAAILEDKAKGLLPFFFCANSGTTNSCAFDNLAELGPICQEHEVWMHVDAAYAGSAFICPEFRPLLNGVEYATSFNFNAHKLLKVTYECSPLWVKNKDHLRYNFEVKPVYLSSDVHDEVMPEFWQWQVASTSKPFRALKLWFVLRLFGISGLQDSIRRDARLAHEMASLVRSDDRFEISADVILGLVCIRLKGANSQSERLLKKIREGGKIHLVAARMHSTFFLRLAICSPSPRSSDVHYAWDAIREAADNVINHPTNQHLD